jgi:hypothetical protein
VEKLMAEIHVHEHRQSSMPDASTQEGENPQVIV